jgi:hypothetical protein
MLAYTDTLPMMAEQAAGIPAMLQSAFEGRQLRGSSLLCACMDLVQDLHLVHSPVAHSV